MIKKEGDRYCLYSKDGGKKLGCHNTEEEAITQEQAIEAEKKRKAAEGDLILLENETELNLSSLREFIVGAPEQYFDADSDDKGPVSRTFLNKLRELLKKYVTPDQLNSAVKQARGYAGGKHRGNKRRRAGDTSTSSEVEYAGSYNRHRLAKDDEVVGFVEEGGADEEHCGNCRFWMVGSCQLVEGTIEAPDVCALHRPPVSYSPPSFAGAELYDIASKEEAS